ncbi:MAG: hypothetical protein M3N98_07625 [Actinomycetota bacterium]|nr:hypothetical protein [Actinomycetota bacterium]
MAVGRPGAGLDRRALARGSATYLAIAIPCALIISLTHGNDPQGQESNLWIAAALAVVFVAPLAAGAAAGAAQARTPLIHGGLAVALPAATFLVIEALVRATQGSLTLVRVLTSLLYLGVFTSCGLLGGYIGFRHRLRST